MFSVTSSFLAFLLFLGIVSASPFEKRQAPNMNCHPNFEGTGVSVTNSAREWGVSGFHTGADVSSKSIRGPMLQNADFKFEQTGSPIPGYIIKEIENNDLVVGLWEDHLQLKNIRANDESQYWDVKCDFCSENASQIKGNVAFGCNITSVTNGKCVTIGTYSTDAMHLADCSGVDAQNFDFWTQIEW